MSQFEDAGARFVQIACLLLLPDPFQGMGTWRKTMDLQKSGNSQGLGQKVAQRQRTAKERAAQIVRSWTVPKMR